MNARANSIVVASLSALTLSITLGCVGSRTVSDVCVVERPNLDVVLEQAGEAWRAENGARPLLPATYEWLKRLDRDIHIFGDPD